VPSIMQTEKISFIWLLAVELDNRILGSGWEITNDQSNSRVV
jgi:hypothetical protein